MGSTLAPCAQNQECGACECTKQLDEYLPVACIGKVWDDTMLADWKLLHSSTDGDVEGIVGALKAGAWIETRGDGFIRPRNSDGVEDAGAQADIEAPGLTSLMRASREGHAAAVQLLLHMRASFTARDEDGMQALHFAAFSGSTETCAALLRAGADPKTVDNDGRTALAHLPEHCHHDRLALPLWESLLKERPDIDGLAGAAIFGQRRHKPPLAKPL